MVDRRRLRAVLATACATAWLFNAGGVAATHRGEGVPDEVALAMSYVQAPVAGGHGQVVALLVRDDGAPVVGVEVEFLRELEFLGPRMIRLGRATTDAYGTARLTLDLNDSTINVRARFTGNEDYLPAEVTSEITLPVGAPGGPAPGEGDGNEPSLAVIAAVMPPLLAAFALAIWLVLFGLTAATVLAIRRDRPSVSVRKEVQS